MENEADAIEGPVASLREDDLSFFICTSFDIIAWIFWRWHTPTVICPCGIYQKVSTDGRLRIYFGKDANPMVLHLSGACVSVTATRPCPPRTRYHCSQSSERLRGQIHEIDVLLCLEVNIQAHVRVNIHASLHCLVGFQNMLASAPRRSTRGGRCSRLDEASSVLQQSSPAICIVLASSCEDASPVETTSPNCREDRFRHPCCDHMDECAFSRSVVARGEVSVSMSSFFAVLLTSKWKHPHHWRPCPRTGHHSCFRAVLSSIYEYLVLVTRSEVLRDGFIDHFFGKLHRWRR